MPSLIGTDVTANYLKASPSTQFATRALKFLVVTFNNGSDSDIDLTAQKASGTGTFSGTYADSDSYLSRVIRAVQNVSEVFAVGMPTATDVTIVIADDTSNSSDTATGTVPVTTGYGVLEAVILANIGVGFKAGLATAYNGTVVCAAKDLNGATLV